jgi:hypothetical protein
MRELPTRCLFLANKPLLTPLLAVPVFLNPPGPLFTLCAPSGRSEIEIDQKLLREQTEKLNLGTELTIIRTLGQRRHSAFALTSRRRLIPRKLRFIPALTRSPLITPGQIF